MKRNFKCGLIGSIISSLIIITSCEKSNTDIQSVDPGDPVNISTENYQKEVIDSANRFAFDLFRPIIAGAKGTGNLMISPFSISSALSMTLNGSLCNNSNL